MILDHVTALCRYVQALPGVGQFARPIEKFDEGSLARLEALGFQVLRKRYDTRDDGARRFEVHDHTVDLMVALEGSEIIHLCDPADLRSAEALPGGADGRKLDGGPQGSAVLLRAGQFIAIMPGEAHMVAGHPDGRPASIDKLVLKLAVEEENIAHCPCDADCARHGRCSLCVVWHRSPDNDLPACLKPKGRLLVQRALAKPEA